MLINALGLQSPSGRLVAFGAVSTLVYLLPYNFVGQFSLWSRLGWESAPSIGLTRAYWLLLHGHPVSAWRRNWLIYLVLAILLPLLASDIWRLKQRRAERIVQNKK